MPYQPDIVISFTSMGIVKLTCLLDLRQHIESETKKKNRILATASKLGHPHHYTTVEVSVLGHYQLDSIKAIKNVICFI